MSRLVAAMASERPSASVRRMLLVAASAAALCACSMNQRYELTWVPILSSV